MSFILDTNIFIVSVYDSLALKATKKFIRENKEPIPFSLNYEVNKKITELILLFRKICFDVADKKKIANGKEIQALKNNFLSFYNVLAHLSNNFSKEENLVDVLMKFADNLYSISSWLETVKCYPDKKDEEKRLLKRKRRILNLLQKSRRLHYADLKIICIANEYAKKGKTKTSFVTKDTGILENKTLLEKTFKKVLIKKISDYV